jgi:hypothetical protein
MATCSQAPAGVMSTLRNAFLFLPLRLVTGSPLHGLLGLSETGWAFDEQLSDAFSVLGPEPPEEELLDDLAQLLLGFLSREELAPMCPRRPHGGGEAGARQSRE